MDPYKDTHAATAFGPACPQQSVKFPNITGLDKKDIKLLMNEPYKVITPDSEDCKFSLTERERFYHQTLTTLNP